MADYDPKADLLRYLQTGRDAIVWKLEGLGEYDVRRPLVPTATNLVGLVKHLAHMEAGYFGAVFGRPFLHPLLIEDLSQPNVEMWAAPHESRQSIIDFYRAACAHSDLTIAAHQLQDEGSVPWWPEDRRRTSLHRLLVHVVAETHRHAGQADLVRELIDGAVGLSTHNSNLPDQDPDWWQTYREVVENAAREAARMPLN
jgi:uncharacterized damage-inducible protein DinB